MTVTMDTPPAEAIPAVGPLPADEFTATLDAAEELEARWAWSDALDGYGDPQPPADWSGLSATHGH